MVADHSVYYSGKVAVAYEEVVDGVVFARAAAGGLDGKDAGHYRALPHHSSAVVYCGSGLFAHTLSP